jgi:hypothetical protein
LRNRQDDKPRPGPDSPKGDCCPAAHEKPPSKGALRCP